MCTVLSDVMQRAGLWLDAEDGVETGRDDAILRWISRSAFQLYCISMHNIPCEIFLFRNKKSGQDSGYHFVPLSAEQLQGALKYIAGLL